MSTFTTQSPKQIVYLSGPMTGVKDFNYPEFNWAASVLTNLGFIVLNPATIPVGLEYNQYLDIDMAMVRAATLICVLDGWKKSKGAKAELAYAECLNKPVFTLRDLLRQTKDQSTTSTQSVPVQQTKKQEK